MDGGEKVSTNAPSGRRSIGQAGGLITPMRCATCGLTFSKGEHPWGLGQGWVHEGCYWKQTAGELAQRLRLSEAENAKLKGLLRRIMEDEPVSEGERNAASA